MVPRGGIEPPTQGFSVIFVIEQASEIRKILLALNNMYLDYN